MIWCALEKKMNDFNRRIVTACAPNVQCGLVKVHDGTLALGQKTVFSLAKLKP
jgi:hypothetical protein